MLVDMHNLSVHTPIFGPLADIHSKTSLEGGAGGRGGAGGHAAQSAVATPPSVVSRRMSLHPMERAVASSLDWVTSGGSGIMAAAPVAAPVPSRRKQTAVQPASSSDIASNGMLRTRHSRSALGDATNLAAVSQATPAPLVGGPPLPRAAMGVQSMALGLSSNAAGAQARTVPTFTSTPSANSAVGSVSLAAAANSSSAMTWADAFENNTPSTVGPDWAHRAPAGVDLSFVPALVREQPSPAAGAPDPVEYTPFSVRLKSASTSPEGMSAAGESMSSNSAGATRDSSDGGGQDRSTSSAAHEDLQGSDFGTPFGHLGKQRVEGTQPQATASQESSHNGSSPSTSTQVREPWHRRVEATASPVSGDDREASNASQDDKPGHTTSAAEQQQLGDSWARVVPQALTPSFASRFLDDEQVVGGMEDAGRGDVHHADIGTAEPSLLRAAAGATTMAEAASKKQPLLNGSATVHTPTPLSAAVVAAAAPAASEDMLAASSPSGSVKTFARTIDSDNGSPATSGSVLPEAAASTPAVRGWHPPLLQQQPSRHRQERRLVTAALSKAVLRVGQLSVANSGLEGTASQLATQLAAAQVRRQSWDVRGGICNDGLGQLYCFGDSWRSVCTTPPHTHTLGSHPQTHA
jgi:hypothetical protein